MEKPITQFSTIELESIGYKATKEKNQLTRTLQTIENELASRAKKAQENKKMDETTNDVVEAGGVHTTEEATETAEQFIYRWDNQEIASLIMQAKITTKVMSGMKTWDAITSSFQIPYIKFSMLGFTQWGDFLDSKVNEWRFLGFKINQNIEIKPYDR